MIAPRVRGALLLVVAALAACKSSSEPKKPVPASVTIVSGDGQTGFVGSQVSQPLVVKVTSDQSTALVGATIVFAVTGGSATVSPATAVTDANGQAQTTVTFGSTAGTVTVTAAVQGTSLSTTFTLTAGSSTTTKACDSSAGTAMTVGQVITPVSGTGICLSADATASAEYALIPFFASTTQSATTSIDVVGTGVLPVTTASLSPANGPSLSRSMGGFGSTPPTMISPINDVQTSFETRLRERARRYLTPLIPSARLWERAQRTQSALSTKIAPTGSASLDAIPSSVTVGQILKLNANANDPCTNPQIHAGRVVAITNRSIVVADTANPTPTFTDAQYASIGTTFDTLVDAVDTAAFGAPTDIDKNGKVLIFFTYAVNQLTPAASSGVVGGFFYERDLFPTTSTSQAQGCPTSNVGEMFYMLVPDPNGTINGNKRDTAYVRQLTIGTTAHEYQHLINAGRRMYVNNANSFEEVWLNEGLSHVAEELLYYRVSGLSPRQNITAATIRATQTSVDVFNDYQNNNFQRFRQFVTKVPNASPYANNDSLETRGATWDLLRYLADHRGAGDADTWRLLVNSSTTGLPNLTNVFGANIMDQIRNWATSVESDDVPGVSDTKFLQPSWNLRSVFVDGYQKGVGPYPLSVVALQNASPSTIPMIAGGEAYVRFSVAAGTKGTVDWIQTGGAPVNALVQFSVVRTK